MPKKDLPDWLLKLGLKSRATKGQTVFLEGEPATGFYALLSGEARGYKSESSGKEIEVARFGAGDLFGEVVAFAHKNYPISVESTGKTELLFFDCSKISTAVAATPEAADFFLNLLAEKCLNLTRRIEHLTLGTVRKRLVAHLLSACRGEDSCTVTLQGSKTELARKLGTISETLSRTLRKLQDEGIIEVDKGTILILDCPKLREELLQD